MQRVCVHVCLWPVHRAIGIIIQIEQVAHRVLILWCVTCSMRVCACVFIHCVFVAASRSCGAQGKGVFSCQLWWLCGTGLTIEPAACSANTNTARNA